jgi:hypothetical protein
LDLSNLNTINSNLSEAEKAKPLNLIKEKNKDKFININEDKIITSIANYKGIKNDNKLGKLLKSEKSEEFKEEIICDEYIKNTREINKEQDIKENYFKAFPINNDIFNFLIVDSNLAIKDNLKNIFFIEFDLVKDQLNHEFLNVFTEINNEKVNKDISFILNVK